MRRCLLDTVAQQHPVGQAGQRIVMDQQFDALLRLDPLGHVGIDIDIVARLPRLLADHRHIEPFRIGLAELALVPDFALPVPVAFDALLHGVVEGRVVPARCQNVRCFPHDFGSGITGFRFEGRIDGQNVVLGIRHENAFATLADGLKSQAQARFRLTPLGNIRQRRYQALFTVCSDRQQGRIDFHPAHRAIGVTQPENQMAQFAPFA